MPNLFLVSNLWALKTPWLLRSITFPEAGELSSFFLFDLGSLGRVVWFCFKIVNSSKLYFLAMINIFLAFRDFFFHITSTLWQEEDLKKKKKKEKAQGLCHHLSPVTRKHAGRERVQCGAGVAGPAARGIDIGCCPVSVLQGIIPRDWTMKQVAFGSC